MTRDGARPADSGARPAGWYDDAADAALLRYWDGRRWSPHTASKAVHRSDEIAGHTVRLRAPDEHTTVPQPNEPAAAAASRPWLARAVARARRRVGGPR